MYLLNKTPIFLEFLKRFMSKAGYVFEDENIQNRLFLHSKCNCGQKDCATVYLKSKKPFKEESTGINIFNTEPLANSNHCKQLISSHSNF